MAKAIQLSENELSELIRLSGTERVVSINWGPDNCGLQDIPQNRWAMLEVARMRGIDLTPATPAGKGSES